MNKHHRDKVLDLARQTRQDILDAPASQLLMTEWHQPPSGPECRTAHCIGGWMALRHNPGGDMRGLYDLFDLAGLCGQADELFLMRTGDRPEPYAFHPYASTTWFDSLPAGIRQAAALAALDNFINRPDHRPMWAEVFEKLDIKPELE